MGFVLLLRRFYNCNCNCNDDDGEDVPTLLRKTATESSGPWEFVRAQPIDNGTEVDVFEETTIESGSMFYRVRANSVEGYIKQEHILCGAPTTLLSDDDEEDPPPPQWPHNPLPPAVELLC